MDLCPVAFNLSDISGNLFEPLTALGGIMNFDASVWGRNCLVMLTVLLTDRACPFRYLPKARARSELNSKCR